MVTTEERRKIGKKSRKSGADFERKVRADLESKGWIVSKWMNQVEFKNFEITGIKNEETINSKQGYLIPAKHKFCGFGRPMAIGTGFPDFIVYTASNCGGYDNNLNMVHRCMLNPEFQTIIFGIECKTNGYLDKEEREKCKWMLEHNIFSKILIAKKGEKKGEIIYEEFKN